MDATLAAMTDESLITEAQQLFDTGVTDEFEADAKDTLRYDQLVSELIRRGYIPELSINFVKE